MKDLIQMPNKEEASDITSRYDAVHLAAEKAVVLFTSYNFSFVQHLKKFELNPSCI